MAGIQHLVALVELSLCLWSLLTLRLTPVTAVTQFDTDTKAWLSC